MSLDSVSISTFERARLTAVSAEKGLHMATVNGTHTHRSSLRLFSRLQFAKNIVYLIFISTDLTQHYALHCQR